MKKNYDDRTWSFLAASPAFDGPVFEEGVILLIEDAKDGSFGVMVNKPTGRTLGEIDARFSKFEELSKIEVFDGGPIAKDRLSIAVWTDDGTQIGEFSFGIPPEKAELRLKETPGAKAAAFVGYSGWGRGQLEHEIQEGSWIVSPADLAMLEDFESGDLWGELVMRAEPMYGNFPPPPPAPPEVN